MTRTPARFEDIVERLHSGGVQVCPQTSAGVTFSRSPVIASNDCGVPSRDTSRRSAEALARAAAVPRLARS